MLPMAAAAADPVAIPWKRGIEHQRQADLGDGTKGWHFDVTLHNVSGTAATYDMSAQALSENISGGLFTGTSSDLPAAIVASRNSLLSLPETL